MRKVCVPQIMWPPDKLVVYSSNCKPENRKNGLQPSNNTRKPYNIVQRGMR
jgi:hypothetical protein